MADKKFSIDFVFNGLAKANTTMTDIEKKQKRSIELSKEQQKAFDNVISMTPVNRLIQMNDQMRDFNNSIKQLGGTGRVADIITSKLADAGTNAKQFAMNMRSLGPAIMGGIGKALPLIGAQIAALAPVVLSLLGPISLIIAGIFLLKKIWDNNIGGIQTKFNQVFGKLKEIWSRFMIIVNKALQAISPILDVILNLIVGPLMSGLNVVLSLFKAIWSILKPIFDAVSEIGKAIKSAFGDMNKQGKGAIDIMGGLGKALELIGKILGFIVSVTIKPIVAAVKFIFGIVGGIVNGVKSVVSGVVDWIENNKILQAGLAVIQGIVGAISAVWNGIKSVGGAILGAVTAPFKAAWGLAKGAIGAIGGAVGGIVKGIGGFFGGLFGGADKAKKKVDELAERKKKLAAMEKLVNSPMGKALKVLFPGMIDKVQKQIDKEKELLALKEKENEEEEKKIAIRNAPVSTSQTVSNQTTRSNTVNNNNNVTVNSSGNITPESAPAVADTMTSALSTGAKL
jgi:hypothetical protein